MGQIYSCRSAGGSLFQRGERSLYMAIEQWFPTFFDLGPLLFCRRASEATKTFSRYNIHERTKTSWYFLL